MAWPGQNMQKHYPIFKKHDCKSLCQSRVKYFNCMLQHFIHTMYYYETLHYKRYTKYKYILFITTLPYRITPKHVITLRVKCPNMENESL